MSLADIGQVAPRVVEFWQQQQAKRLTEKELSDVVLCHWKSKPMKYDPWLAYLFLPLQIKRDICTFLNHSAGFGCNNGGKCNFCNEGGNRCLFCNAYGHGIYGPNQLCPRLQAYNQQMQSLIHGRRFGTTECEVQGRIQDLLRMPRWQPPGSLQPGSLRAPPGPELAQTTPPLRTIGDFPPLSTTRAQQRRSIRRTSGAAAEPASQPSQGPSLFDVRDSIGNAAAASEVEPTVPLPSGAGAATVDHWEDRSIEVSSPQTSSAAAAPSAATTDQTADDSASDSSDYENTLDEERVHITATSEDLGDTTVKFARDRRYHLAESSSRCELWWAWRTSWTGSREKVVVKLWERKRGRVSSDTKKQIQSEIDALKRLQSEHVVSIREHGTGLQHGERKFHYVVMEYAGSQNLAQKLLQTQITLNADDVREIASQLFDAYIYCHENNIMHRDVKPDNIIVVDNPQRNRKWQVKLCDFELSKLFDYGVGRSQQYGSTVVGTFADRSGCWVAPEVIRVRDGDAPYDKASDLWGLGCVIFWLCNLQSPFRTDQDVLQAEQNRDYLAKCLAPEGSDFKASHPFVHDVVRRLVQPAGTRPSLEGLRAHPLFWQWNQIKSHVCLFSRLVFQFRDSTSSQNFNKAIHDELPENGFHGLLPEAFKTILRRGGGSCMEERNNSQGWALLRSLRNVIEHSQGMNDVDLQMAVQDLVDRSPYILISMWENAPPGTFVFEVNAGIQMRSQEEMWSNA